MKSKEKKYIIDTTLRDGEQSPFVHLTGEHKIKIASMLDDMGVYQIEAGISAMGKEEQNVMCKIIEQAKNAKISVWSRLHPDDVRKALECKPDVVHISIPVSYLHIYTKLGKNKSWILKRLTEILDMLSASDCGLSIGFEDASRADLSFVMKLVAILEQANTKMIRFADTVGISPPYAIREMVSYLHSFTSIPIEIHAHNDLGMAIANTAEALRAGAIYADTTLLGVGERSGNCDMLKLLRLMSPVFDMNIDSNKAEEAEIYFAEILTHINHR